MGTHKAMKNEIRRRFTSCTQNSLFSYQIQRNKVTGISTNAFKNNTVLKTVAIGKNVTVIGANAFYGCKKLSKVSGGNSIVKIGGRAFANWPVSNDSLT